MSPAALAAEIAAGVEFSGFDDFGDLIGVMGIQPVRNVFLIRRAYVPHCPPEPRHWRPTPMLSDRPCQSSVARRQVGGRRLSLSASTNATASGSFRPPKRPPALRLLDHPQSVKKRLPSSSPAEPGSAAFGRRAAYPCGRRASRPGVKDFVSTGLTLRVH